VPICIAGTLISGKANYTAHGSFGFLSPGPKTYIYIGSQGSLYTNNGIKENGYFRVNITSEDQMQKTDYVRLVSGRDTDKSSIFNSFFGSADKAPMIKECPVNILCKLVKTADLPNREIFLEKYWNPT
jgi:flavin reductase (DIM6/NTAB) family NADH-FMN oxidoreductase RutF